MAADLYLTEDDVYAAMGADVVRSLLDESGTNLTLMIQRCTGLVKGYLRANGYTPPVTTVPATITEETVKLGTMALVRQWLCSMPASTLSLPEEWKDHPERCALDTLRSDHKGEAVLDLPQSSIKAPGGWGFTPAVSGSSNEQRTSRTNLWGY